MLSKSVSIGASGPTNTSLTWWGVGQDLGCTSDSGRYGSHLDLSNNNIKIPEGYKTCEYCRHDSMAQFDTHNWLKISSTKLEFFVSSTPLDPKVLCQMHLLVLCLFFLPFLCFCFRKSCWWKRLCISPQELLFPPGVHSSLQPSARRVVIKPLKQPKFNHKISQNTDFRCAEILNQRFSSEIFRC